MWRIYILMLGCEGLKQSLCMCVLFLSFASLLFAFQICQNLYLERNMANKICLACLLRGSFEEWAPGLVPRKGFFFTIRKPLSAQDYKWVPLNCEPETNRLPANCCISNIYVNHLQHGVLALGVKDLIPFVTHLRFSTFRDFLKRFFKQKNQQLFILKTSVT